MNRLTALEANNTLYARYVEEQTAGVREVLRRLGEDVGRLDGIVSDFSAVFLVPSCGTSLGLWYMGVLRLVGMWLNATTEICSQV